jgi:membrane protease YdiL (CAAX protease family)
VSSCEVSTPALVKGRKQPRLWKFFGTTMWGLAALGAVFAAELLTILLVLIWFGDLRDPLPLLEHGGTTAAATVAECPAVLAVLWIAIRLARRRFASYLALRWPSRNYLLIGVAVSLAVVPIWDGLSHLTGHVMSPSFVLDTSRTARDAGLQWLLLIAACVAAPITEEFMVRGFLYRGFAASFLGPVGAIVLSSAMWAAIHVQYDWYFMTEVLVIGLIFGYLRYRSGSTWLTVMMHGLINFAAFAQAAWIVAQT